MHRIGYLLDDGFQMLLLATQTVFELANQVTGEHFYSVETYSPAGGLVQSSLGLTLETRPLSSPEWADTWIVVGDNDPVANKAAPTVLEFVRQADGLGRRIAGVCSGGFILAEAGLLAGRRATTHWAYAQALQKRHPEIIVEDDRIYISDGSIWTSAGMTAGIDLAVGMVEEDLGADVARSVARRLVMLQHRSGGQSQHSEMLDLAPKSERIKSVLNYVRSHLNRSISVEELAGIVHLSPRQFTRVFTAETGQSPAKAIESLRLEAARLMIKQSRQPLDVVAREAGFRDRRHMREAFIRGFGMPPQAVRRDALRAVDS
ncbi:GlxA family transcriptional regulator [Pseudomonas aeruginosa]|nr:GlxA family transcriptional regulator [Pseudomonas aeruginosa]